MLKPLTIAAFGLLVAGQAADARVVRLRIERRELILNGRLFGAAGAYEKLIGKVDFVFDPAIKENEIIVDLPLAARNANGEVEASADFYMLKPVDPRRGNGQLFYEVGNRGGKAMLATFQKAVGSPDPTTDAQIGDGALMNQGFTLLWMGWQWDVPLRAGVMRMDMPIATNHGQPIIGLVRGNFIPNARDSVEPVADRNHQAYAPIDRNNPQDLMTVRDDPIGKGTVIPRNRWHWVDSADVALDGGFEPGRIYDVVYHAANPRVVGVGLAGTRDLVSFLKYDTTSANPVPGIRYAISWGVSQSGRFQRHFLYQGFNEDERGRRVFDGMFDQLGGAGRGSFNHRFGQASRDALQFFNILFPVDLFPFTDAAETDPETGVTDALLARANATHTAPKLFHLLGNSEYFNRAGSLVHTDPAGTKDADIPVNVRIYMIASAPHVTGVFPPTSNKGGGMVGRAALNPLNISPAVRALFRALDRWVVEDVPPPPSTYPRIADGTLVPLEKAGWPAIPGYPLPQQVLHALHLDFGPEWSKGIVTNEPPIVGKPFPQLIPAVDADGNVRSGIRLPEIAVPLGTQTGWNYRDTSIGRPDRLAGEIGSYIPFSRTRADRARANDPRLSIAERYRDRDEFVGKYSAAAVDLVNKGFLLPEDVPDLLRRATEFYDWAVRP